jgi:phosphate transport system ATP-binding protein
MEATVMQLKVKNQEPPAETAAETEEKGIKSKIKVRRLNAYFGAVQILKEINVKMQEGKVTAIIGPSGCGKSTFIRCLNRMHELTAQARIDGRVLLDGQDIYNRPVDLITLRRKVGMVFQRPNPFPTLSIYDNVVAGLKLTGFRNKQALDETVESSLTMAALWDEVKDKLHRSGMSLSGGQQQRLCIARALAVKPEVILFDEPCSALDPISTGKIEELIHSLKNTYTMVIVTHNMQQAARISDYTGYFYMGSLVEFGATRKIFTNPDKKETEDYITGRFG